MNRLRRARRDLLNTVGSDSEYPNTVSLPNKIHNAVLDAVEETGQDKRERSVHFRYRCNTWLSGIAFRGSRSKDSVSFLHMKLAEVYPPDIHFHTHPVLAVEAFRQDVMSAAEGRGAKISEKTRDRMADMAMRAHALTTRLPSAPDMYSSILRPLGNLAHLVASDHGSFLWVRREVPWQPQGNRDEWRGFVNNVEAQTSKADNIEISLTNPRDFTASLQNMLDTRVTILDPMYVCYASDHIDSPEMHRLG